MWRTIFCDPETYNMKKPEGLPRASEDLLRSDYWSDFEMESRMVVSDLMFSIL